MEPKPFDVTTLILSRVETCLFIWVLGAFFRCDKRQIDRLSKYILIHQIIYNL